MTHVIQKRKILFVEDDVFISEVVARRFVQEGFEVVHAARGDEALQAIRKEKPDLIMLDLALPDMDGFEIFDLIRNEKESKKTPIVIYSNNSGIENQEKAKEKGARMFIVKAKHTPSEVVEKIRRILK